MNENEFTVTFVAVDKKNDCEGCILEDSRCGHGSIIGQECCACQRTDGRNVIFKIKES